MKSTSPLHQNEVHFVRQKSTTGGTRDSLPLFSRDSGPAFFSGTSCGLASTSSTDLSHSFINATQMTQDTISGDIRDNNSPFACPFFKRNPRTYGKTCSRGWTQFHRLKEHVFRKHCIPRYRCSRCLSCFDNSDGLEEHIRSVEPCKLRESTEVEGINAEQERRLRTRKRTKTEADSNEVVRNTQRWYEMYKIIFPDADVQTISPYNDYNSGAYTAVGSSETIADYSKFVDGGIPSEVQNKLQATIYRELGCSELDVRRIIDILPMLQRTLLQSFQNQNDN